MPDERQVLEPVRRSDVQPDTLVLTHLPQQVIGPAVPVLEEPDAVVYRIIDWMPACPPGVDAAKWTLVVRQLETIHSVLEEADQAHLGPESVMNLLTEVTVISRKLGVELEAVLASLRRSVKKTASA